MVRGAGGCCHCLWQAGCWAFGKALAAAGGHLAAFQRRQVSGMLSPVCPGMVLKAVSNMELKN